MPVVNMSELNCSFAALFPIGAAVFNDVACPEAALMCGMNISSVLANATAQDLDDMCMSEADYLAMYLGPPRSPVFLPVCVTYLIIFAVGVLGNYLTCAVILRHRVMQTPTNYYLLSLAASDLAVLLMGMPLEIYELWQNYPFLLGEGGCYFKTFLFETVCFASILNVTALSVERYVAVVHPLKVKQITTHAHVKRVILMLWALSMLCAVPNTSLHGIVTLPPKFGRQFPRSAICCVIQPPRIYSWIVLISTLAFFLLPMLIISILYLLIGLRLKSEKMNASLVDTSFGPERRSYQQKLSKRNLQVTKMLCVLVLVFGLCWAPFHADRLMWSYIELSSEWHHQLFELVHVVSGVCFYLSSAINPILYNLMSTRFREMYRRSACYPQSRPANGSDVQTNRRSTFSERIANSTKSST
uniref:LOW QUALITY PROTEIN: neuromedin-U receptor 1-like n=1 Tax=Gasterosteus aculeatus aculeatus TaxID=481459 RepID=UPI001A9873F6|nr:LOW QUALITY PROTEIN: neuromedin-U receptor 1-like [Gasterosteus aculeatus aculeatus]